MTYCVIAMGSNMGDRLANLQNALEALSEKVGILKKSRIYETKPVGYLDQGDFLNGAIFGTTLCTPFELLCFLKQIEKKMGRANTFRNAPRPIDLDIIFYGEVRINMRSLKIPHIQWRQRQFVYVPLRDFCDDAAFAAAFPFEREIIKVLPKSEIFAKYEM